MVRVAINGFGRIGRNFVRCLLTRENSNLELVGINDTSDPKTNAHLLRYDSMLGVLDADIQHDTNSLTINGNTVKCVSDRNPLNLPWKEWDIDIVIESTGVFRDKEGAGKHLQAGAKKVVITAPGTILSVTIASQAMWLKEMVARSVWIIVLFAMQMGCARHVVKASMCLDFAYLHGDYEFSRLIL